MSLRAQNREMARVNRGYFGVAVYRPKTEANVGSLWRSASAFGAAYLATVGRRYPIRQSSDTTNARQHIPLMHFPTVADLIEHLPFSCPLVGVELDSRAIELDSYRHPQRALYLLGAEDQGLPMAVLDVCHDLVRIPTVTPWSINLACAGSTVLFDRYAKLRELVPA